jgi:hypothetical protein
VKDAVDHVRTAAQELYKAISDAAVKRGGAARADLEAVPQKAKAAIDSIKGSVAAQNEVTKKRLAEAVTCLEASGQHAAEGVKSSGKQFQTAVRQTIADVSEDSTAPIDERMRRLGAKVYRRAWSAVRDDKWFDDRALPRRGAPLGDVFDG